jgi:hypothetical protein
MLQQLQLLLLQLLLLLLLLLLLPAQFQRVPLVTLMLKRDAG